MNSNFNPSQEDIFKENLLSEEAQKSLFATGKWGKFLAIVNFIILGILLLFVIFFSLFLTSSSIIPSGFMDNFALGLFPILYIAMIIIYCIPNYFLLKFSNNLKNGIANQSPHLLASAFHIQKVIFQIIGVMTIGTIALYTLIFIIGIVAGLMN